VPTPERPFLFYHLEKSGGSTLRPHLVRASLELGAAFFVPCYDAQGRMDRTYVSCHKWGIEAHTTLEERTSLAVVAGHFPWGVRHELPAAQGRAQCFTILRDPVERIISFYYERVQPFTGKGLGEIDIGELDFLMREFYGSAFGRFRDEVSADML
jgi:hypothetical protein